MAHPWNAWVEATLFAAEAQWVVTLRLMRLAAGGALAASEAQRMITEKVVAGSQAQLAAGMALASGRGLEAASRKAATPYKRKVRANRRRLMRRR